MNSEEQRREGQRPAREQPEGLARPSAGRARRGRSCSCSGRIGSGRRRRRQCARCQGCACDARRAARARNGSGRAACSRLRFARQVEVPQARDPEAQRRRAQHRRQQRALGAGQRAHALVGGHEGGGARRRRARRWSGRCTSRSGTRPGRTARCRCRRSRSRRSRTAGRGPAVVVEHHVVAEQVGVDRPARQRRHGRRRGHVVLEGQLVAQQRGLRRRPGAAAPPAPCRSTRPGRAGWAGARRSRAPARCMRASIAPTCAQCVGVGRQPVAAGQPRAPRRPACRPSVVRRSLAARRRRCGAGTGMPRAARCCISRR